MKLGIDCVTSTLGHTAALKALGVEFVLRYVSTPGNAKNATADEVHALLAAGLDPKLVFETYETRALTGARGGALDALAAREQAAAVGLPDVILYFAVDYDAPAADHPRIEAYIRAANGTIENTVGVYGSYSVVEHCLDTGVCTEAVQTYGWSHGQLSTRAQIWQVLNGQTLAGLPVDLNIGRF